MASFGSILDKQSTEIERPKPLPHGTYTCVVKGLPRQDKSPQKQTEFVEFTLQPLAAGDDVDQDELKAMGGFNNRTLRSTYYLTEDSIWRLKKFLTDLGIDEEDKSLRQMIDETPNRQVLVTVKHTPSQDGETMYANVAGTAKAE